MLGLALARFGRDPRSSDSLRGSRNVVVFWSGIIIIIIIIISYANPLLPYIALLMLVHLVIALRTHADAAVIGR